jgi:type II secretory pathway pseudopilin PulG
MSILSKNDQKGRSMVEMLGVLAIIGVLSVGGISGYSKAMAKFKLTKAQDQISMLLMNIRTAFATSPSYAGLNNGNADAFAIAPGYMYPGIVSQSKSVAQLNNAFGGGAHVFACDDPEGSLACAGPSGFSATSQYFAIALTNLGREACVSLASSDWGTDGLLSVQVGQTGGALTPFTAADLPLSLLNAGTACGDYGDRATIVWTYY